MRPRTILLSVAVLGLWLGCPAPAGAHRLDEYLQVTRLSIDLERVSLEIDLSPGVSVAPRIFALIDTDHDRQISVAEGEAYAREVLRSIALSVDDRPIAIALEDSQFPEIGDMNLGVGTIHLRATATVPSSTVGRHQVSYVNDHGPVASVYLVNALVPADPRIEIARPLRDVAQRTLRLEYSVMPDARWARIWWSLAGLAMVGLLVCARWPWTGSWPSAAQRSGPAGRGCRSTRVRYEHPDHSILSGREEKLAVARPADM